MTLVHGFPPLADPRAELLILGSMPGRASLQADQYYAHPRNAFWPILGRVLGFAPAAPYAERCAHLCAGRVALWDVLEACVRPGSLDADIDEASIRPNDFATFFAAHARVRQVLFNGAMAEKSYRRHVMSGLPPAAAALPVRRMPSTSPAHAALSLEQKVAVWQAALRDAGIATVRP